MSSQPHLSVSPSPDVATDQSTAAASPASASTHRRTLLVYAAGAVVGAAILVIIAKNAPSGADEDVGGKRPISKEITVNTIVPVPRTLERFLEQPGSIRPCAQSELYSKVSGHLKRIQRELSAPVLSEAMIHHAAVVSSGPAGDALSAIARLAKAVPLCLDNGPEKDIGSLVHAGEVILEIDAPELEQDIVQKRSLWQQSLAEVELARSHATTAHEAVAAALANVDKAESERNYRLKELARLQGLAASKTIRADLVDECQNQVNATTAALKSAQAESKVVSSKLETAKADLTVKEARVRVAQDEYRRAQIFADFTRIRAPFDGVITSRLVDEGDFIQNSSSGQLNRLMVLACVERVRFVLHVPEREAVWVRQGIPVEIDFDAGEHLNAKASVSRLSHALDPQSRTMQVEIDLDNRDGRYFPGMYGNAKLLLQKQDHAYAIPVSAVYSRKGENHILLVEKGVARRQQVRIRYDDGKEMEVVKVIKGKEVPLQGTEELIISNRGELSDGQRVKTNDNGKHTASRKSDAKNNDSPGVSAVPAAKKFGTGTRATADQPFHGN